MVSPLASQGRPGEATSSPEAVGCVIEWIGKVLGPVRLAAARGTPGARRAAAEDGDGDSGSRIPFFQFGPF